MRKIPVLILAAVLLAFAQGCSVKHSLGYVNNDIAWRQSFGDMKTELSLGGFAANLFGDSVTEVSGYYKSEEAGTILSEVSLGLGFYYRVFKNEIFDLSVGLKFRNYFTLSYYYTYYFLSYPNFRQYRYDETVDFGFLNSNRLSLMLPDVEINSPFSDNLKFTVSVELLYCKWAYKGGNYKDTFWQQVSTSAGYSESPDNSGTVSGPGAPHSFKGGSDIFSIGGITAGVMYYF